MDWVGYTPSRTNKDKVEVSPISGEFTSEAVAKILKPLMKEYPSLESKFTEIIEEVFCFL